MRVDHGVGERAEACALLTDYCEDIEEVPRAPCPSIQSADQQRISFLQRCDSLGELASISNSAAYLLREYTLCASGS